MLVRLGKLSRVIIYKLEDTTGHYQHDIYAIFVTKTYLRILNISNESEGPLTPALCEKNIARANVAMDDTKILEPYESWSVM